MREAAEAMIREAWEDEPLLAEALRTERSKLGRNLGSLDTASVSFVALTRRNKPVNVAAHCG